MQLIDILDHTSAIMGPKKTPPQASVKPKKTLKVITIEQKKDIIEKHERGVRLSDLYTVQFISLITIQ